eukprot:scaffold2118_cov391-Prasinococcus_capsulatus_cf.AAC.1
MPNRSRDIQRSRCCQQGTGFVDPGPCEPPLYEHKNATIGTNSNKRYNTRWWTASHEETDVLPPMTQYVLGRHPAGNLRDRFQCTPGSKLLVQP